MSVGRSVLQMCIKLLSIIIFAAVCNLITPQKFAYVRGTPVPMWMRANADRLQLNRLRYMRGPRGRELTRNRLWHPPPLSGGGRISPKVGSVFPQNLVSSCIALVFTCIVILTPPFCLPLYRACISCISQVLKTCVDLGPRYTYGFIRYTIQIVSIDTSRYMQIPAPQFGPVRDMHDT